MHLKTLSGVIMLLNLTCVLQVTAICRNDNPNLFDPFAVEVSPLYYYKHLIDFHCIDAVQLHVHSIPRSPLLHFSKFVYLFSFMCSAIIKNGILLKKKKEKIEYCCKVAIIRSFMVKTLKLINQLEWFEEECMWSLMLQ